MTPSAPDDDPLLRTVVRRHGLPSTPVSGPAWPGVMNDVRVVGTGSQRYVVRSPRDPRRPEEVTVEAWCAARARAGGVPTPEVVATGEVAGVPYSVQRFADGRPGPQVQGTAAGTAVWHTLGRYSRALARFPLDGAPDGLFSRFGRDLPAAWRAHVASNVAALDAHDPLLSLGALDLAQQARARETVAPLADLGASTAGDPAAHLAAVHGLAHGDLALRNVVLPDDGPPVLLDWGAATTGPVPHTDLLHLLRTRDDDATPGDADLEAFADGAGVDLAALAPTLAAMRLLAAVDLVRWALDRRPDLVGETVAALRRLTG